MNFLYKEFLGLRDKKLLQNMSFVFACNSLSQVLVLLSLPIALRKLGLAGWDTVVFSQIFINNAVWIIGLGFNLSATVKIAQTKSLAKRQRITLTVIIIQAVIFLGLAIASAIYIKFINGNASKDLVYNMLLMIGATVLSMHWLLTGLENFKLLSIIKIFPKLILLAMLILEPIKLTAITYLYFVSLSELIVSIGICFLLVRGKLIWFRRVSFNLTKSLLAYSFKVFLVQCIPNAKETALKLFIGTLFTEGSLAVFNVAERLKGAAITLFHPILHVTFPNVAAQANYSQHSFLSVLKRAYLMQATMSMIVFIGIICFSVNLVVLFAGDQFIDAALLLQIFAVSVVVIPLTDLTINNIFVAKRENVSYAISSSIQCFLVIVSVFIFSSINDLTSVVAGVVVGEAVSLLLIVWYVYLYRHKFF